METARISALLAPFLPGPLNDTQLDQLSTYLDLLLRWNQRINLTAVRDPNNIVTRHFGESLFAGAVLFPRSRPYQVAHAAPSEAWNPVPTAASRLPHVIDIGSGAGFPGVPLKIWAPNIQPTLIESNNKKAAFLRELIRSLTLTNIDVFPGRANTFATTGDVVTLRAVECFDDILPIAARLVAPGGRLALLIGSSQIQSAQQACGFDWADPQPLPGSRARNLLVGTKQQESEM